MMSSSFQMLPCIIKEWKLQMQHVIHARIYSKQVIYEAVFISELLRRVEPKFLDSPSEILRYILTMYVKIYIINTNISPSRFAHPPILLS